MRILIATPLYPPQVGGPAKYAKHLADEFTAQGHLVSVVAYGRVERALPSGLRHAWYFARLVGRMGRVDAVLALDTFSVGLPALYAAKLYHKKLVVRIGGDALWETYVERTKELIKLGEFYDVPRSLSRKERVMQKGVERLARYATFAFTTEWQRGLWAKAYGPSATALVPNFYPAPSEPHEPRGRIFIAAGRDTVLKNKQGLHKVFAQVKKAHPDIELDERVLPPQEHLMRLKSCYAVIVASISEVNPNTAIEAAAARKPFIAPLDCGGKEALSGMGLFVDTADTQALEETFTSLLNQATYDACVKASAQLAPYSWSDSAKEYLALFAGRDDKAGANTAQEVR